MSAARRLILSAGSGCAGVRHLPWRPLESAVVDLGCYRPGDECGGGTKNHNLPALPRGMKSCGVSDSSLKFGDLNRSPA